MIEVTNQADALGVRRSTIKVDWLNIVRGGIILVGWFVTNGVRSCSKSRSKIPLLLGVSDLTVQLSSLLTFASDY